MRRPTQPVNWKANGAPAVPPCRIRGQFRRLVTATRRMAAVLLVSVGWTGTALAQSSSASFQIPRQSIEGGAGRATSATYTLNGTIGQPDAGAPMTSATFAVRGGFHRAAPAAPLPDPLFSDGFEAP